MQRRWLEMQDFWTLQPTKLDENKKHLFECKDNKSPTGHSLLVRLAATHAGRVNNNKRFYRPDKVQEATHTWVSKPNPVPVLVEHNKQGDVMGRVRTAKYIDETHKFDEDYPIIRDTLFYNTDATTRLSLFDSVDWIVDNLGSQQDFAGLGYIELGTQITNPEAIRKVFNDEFLNVSVGFGTDSAICSICKTDWAVDDKCNHKLGSKVDGKETYLITGNLDYREVSFVNFPADPFATKLSVEQFTDSLNKKFYLGLSVNEQEKLITAAGLTMTDSLITYDDDITVSYEDSMELNDFKLETLENFLTEIKSKDLTSAKAFEFKAAVDSLTPETPVEKTKVRGFKSTLNARIKKEGWSAVIETVIDPVTASEMDAAFDSAKPEPVATVETPAIVNPWEGFSYANADEQAFFEDAEGLIAEIELEFIAAGLTDAKYEIADNAYCGPNNTFAVIDANSAAACRAVIGKAPISEATKLKLEDCIAKQELALGLNLADALEPFETLYTDAKGGVGAKVIGTYSDLHNHFTAADWDTRGKIKNLHEAVGYHWSALSNKERSEKALINDGHEVNPYSDRVEKLAKNEFEGQDGDISANALGLINKLDKLYDGASEDLRPKLYSATQAVISDWSTDDYVRYAKARLAECADSYTVLSSAELAEKDDAVNDLTADKTDLLAKLAAEKAKSVAFFNETKKALATQIIMSKIISGADGFKDLTKEKLDEKIAEFSKRNIISLKDSVKDILIEQKFLTPSSTNTQEAIARVEENMQVSDADAVVILTDSKPAVDSLEEVYTVYSAFKYLSPSEQERFFAEKRWSSK